MMALRRCLLTTWSMFLVYTLSSAIGEGQFLKTKLDAKERNNDVIDWDYSDGPSGPAHWGELNPSWKVCSEGKTQSPINIETSNLSYNENLDTPLIHEYQDSPAFVLNTGHSAQVLWAGGYHHVNGKNYTLTHIDFHSPSEHTIDGKSYPLEMQMVHISEDGDYAIIVVLSNYGPTNWWVEKFWNLIPSLDNVLQPVPVGIISPKGFGVNYSKYYRYVGSITVPDCQENVVWSILSTVYEISEVEIKHLRSVVPNANNRPIQPLQGRQVSVSFQSAAVTK